MRRPLLLVLLALCLVIVFLYFADPIGLGTALLPRTGIDAQDGSVYAAEGVVTRIEEKDGYLAVTLKVGRESILIRLSADVPDPYDLVGRRAEAAGMITLPDGRRNPGCFDYRLYLKSRRIFHVMDVSRFRFTAGEVKHPLIHALSVLKGRFYARVRPYLSDRQFQLTAGLLFGETSYMDEDLYEEFRLNGIAHVLAVSGLHVGLLYSVILRLLGGRRNLRTTVAVSASLLAYAALSYFSVSVLRASFMIGLNMLAFHIKRRYDLTSAATLCAIVFLLDNPYRLFDSGMQLSFCAAYTMGTALPWAVSKGIQISDKYRKKWIKAAFDIFAPTVMVQLGMTPLILFLFTTFSPAGILINPLAVILAGLLLPAGLLCFLVSQFFGGLPLAAAAGI
ncbi:MAG: ComEC/Rec2 family competence protein [Firmicutes bacterium]|nr:ComEC/Rec2 family competence protein [Bacillota bacterium]